MRQPVAVGAAVTLDETGNGPLSDDGFFCSFYPIYGVVETGVVLFPKMGYTK
jgi:hypothetical protein